MGAFNGNKYGAEFVYSKSGYMGSIAVSSALAVTANDWPSTSSTAQHILEVSSVVAYAINLTSTSALLPTTSGSGTTASSGQNIVRNAGTHYYEIPGGSTGYSICGKTTGEMSLSFWRRA